MSRKTTSSSQKKHSSIPPKVRSAAAVKDREIESKQLKIETAGVAVVEPKLMPVSAAATKELIVELSADSTATRAHAAEELGNQRDACAADALIAAARDYDADVAREAVTSIGKLGDRAMVPALIEVLENANGYFHTVVRAAAAVSLAQLHDVRSLDALILATRDEIAEVSVEAIRALGALGDARAVETLSVVVRNATGFFLPTVRRASVLALAQIGGEQAIAELRAVAANTWEDQVIRADATHATTKREVAAD